MALLVPDLGAVPLPLERQDPDMDYEFGEVVGSPTAFILSSQLPREIGHVRCDFRQAVARSGGQQLPAAAKRFIIMHPDQIPLLARVLRIWHKIDTIDRPGSGKLLRAYLWDQELQFRSKDGEMKTARVPIIVAIQEASPDAPLSIRRNFDQCYAITQSTPIGRGGNAGGVNMSLISHGGVYPCIDIAGPGKPTATGMSPSLVVKRVDGRDTDVDRGINTNEGEQKLLREISTWIHLHYPVPHPRVVRIFDAFLDTVLEGTAEQRSVASIVMEGAPAGQMPIINPSTGQLQLVDRPTDLVAHIVDKTKRPMTLYQAVHVLTQVLMTLFHMHSRLPSCLHRDVKGDNIILWDVLQVDLYTMVPVADAGNAGNGNATAGSADAHSSASSAPGASVPMVEQCIERNTTLFLVKLADFGEARHVSPADIPHTNVGTDAYKAPEVMAGLAAINPQGQTGAVDVYSCGVTLFTLLLAAAPFGIAWDAGALPSLGLWRSLLSQGSAALPRSNAWPSFQRLPRNAQDLVIRMMDANPSTRITIPEALTHPLFTDASKVYYKLHGAKIPLVPQFA